MAATKFLAVLSLLCVVSFSEAYFCQAIHPSAVKRCPRSIQWYQRQTCKKPRIYMISSFGNACRYAYNQALKLSCNPWIIQVFQVRYVMQKGCMLSNGKIVVDSILKKAGINLVRRFCHDKPPPLDETKQEGGYLPKKLPSYCHK